MTKIPCARREVTNIEDTFVFVIPKQVIITFRHLAITAPAANSQVFFCNLFLLTLSVSERETEEMERKVTMTGEPRSDSRLLSWPRAVSYPSVARLLVSSVAASSTGGGLLHRPFAAPEAVRRIVLCCSPPGTSLACVVTQCSNLLFSHNYLIS